MTLRPHRLAHLTALCVLTAFAAATIPATAAATTIHVPGTVFGHTRSAGVTSLVVTAQPGTTIPGAESLSSNGSQYAVTVAAGAVGTATRALDASGAVKAVEADTKLQWSDYQLNGYTNDPLASQEWALDTIGWHSISVPSTSPTIAFLDSGLDVEHPEFAGTLANGEPKVATTWNAVTGSSDVADELGHGTGTAGIAAGLTNNDQGIASIAPGSQVMEIQVGGMDGVELSDAVRGLNYAVAHGARVVNMSFGSSENSTALTTAVENAISQGVVVVAAAGNDGCSSQGGADEANYPAALPHVIAVAASNQSNGIACFSEHGPEIALAAPGVNLVLPTEVGSEQGTLEDPSGYETGSGTSFAAPIVSGAVALLLAEHPTWTPEQVRYALMATAMDVGAKGWDQYSGAGIVNLPKLLAYSGPLPHDSQEANDDVAQANTITPLLKAGHRSASVRALLDSENDPSDVYRIYVRRAGTVTISLRSARRVTINLWKPGTRTVKATGSTRTRTLAGTTTRTRLAVKLTRPGVYYLQFALASGNGAYAASVTAR